MTRRRAVSFTKPAVTWILVADDRKAQVYVRKKTEKHIPFAGRHQRRKFAEMIAVEPVVVEDMRWQAESAEPFETGRNATGMVFESANPARSVSEPHINVEEELREHLARTVAEELKRAYGKKRFSRLVLIAPPKMLGELRKHLDTKLLKVITAEMPKEVAVADNAALTECLEQFF